MLICLFVHSFLLSLFSRINRLALSATLTLSLVLSLPVSAQLLSHSRCCFVPDPTDQGAGKERERKVGMEWDGMEWDSREKKYARSFRSWSWSCYAFDLALALLSSSFGFINQHTHHTHTHPYIHIPLYIQFLP